MAEKAKAAAEAAPAEAEKKTEKAGKTVEKEAADTNAAAMNAVGDALPPVGASREHPEHKQWFEYKPLPKRPTLKTVGKAALTAATIVNPVTTAAVALPVYAGVSLWKRASKIWPLSWIDKKGHQAYSAAVEGYSSVMEVGTYLPRAASSLAGNALKLPFNILGWGVHKAVDILHITPGESKNLIEAIVHAAFKIPKVGAEVVGKAVDVTGNIAKAIVSHPIRSLAAGTVLAGALYSSGGFAGFSQQIAQGGVNALNGFGTLLSSFR
ncbi:MAG: hypothetical protein ABL890_03750 [Candidatus Peribacteraceae bacterium]